MAHLADTGKISEVAEAVASLPSLRSQPIAGLETMTTDRSQAITDQPTETQAERSEKSATWLEAAAERVKQIAWLQPDQWAHLDIHEKVVALNAAGRALAEVYHIPSPPLLVLEMDHPGAYGSYADGYRLNVDTGQVEGADYAIKMNLAAGINYEKLFGDDPAVALETYAHEFRHSYQAEQVTRYQKPQHRNLVDDQRAAQTWTQAYIGPDEDYQAYYDQPVEKDAREFADSLVKRVYRS